MYCFVHSIPFLVHSGRRIEGKHFRVSQSQPPVARSRAPPETARSRQGGSRPLPHSEGSKTERARRPTSLITREGSDPQKAAAKRSTDTFKIMSKRSQSVGNVSRNKGKETERMRPTSSHRDVGEVTEIFSKEMVGLVKKEFSLGFGCCFRGYCKYCCGLS